MTPYDAESMNRKVQILKSFWAISRVTTQFVQQDAACHGLSLQQLSVVNTLLQTPDLTLDQLAEKRFTPKSTMSSVVDSLVKLELVDRAQSTTDRREIRLRLTPKGESLSKTSSEDSTLYKQMDHVLEQVSEEDVQTLIRIHGQMLTALQKQA